MISLFAPLKTILLDLLMLLPELPHPLRGSLMAFIGAGLSI